MIEWRVARPKNLADSDMGVQYGHCANEVEPVYTIKRVSSGSSEHIEISYRSLEDGFDETSLQSEIDTDDGDDSQNTIWRAGPVIKADGPHGSVDTIALPRDSPSWPADSKVFVKPESLDAVAKEICDVHLMSGKWVLEKYGASTEDLP